VGVGTDEPEARLHVVGDVKVEGKIIASEGIDPPYISFTAETRESIREYAKKII